MERVISSAALSAAVALVLSTGTAARAQDAVRGESLYRELPAEPTLGSCISCHGEPANNRNSVLRGAAGALISRTIAAVSRMGYLRQYLGDVELADISAYLASVVPAGPVDSLPAPWPTTDDFGAHQVGTQSPPRELLIRNLQPRSDLVIGAVLSSDSLVFPVQHDCPLSLPPLGQCRVTASFRPQMQGGASSTFSVVDSGGRELRRGSLSGQGSPSQPPTLLWMAGTPGLIDFGPVALGEAVRRVLTLHNPSATPVTLRILRVTGPNASRFTLSAPCADARRLDAGTSCAVSVGFAPTSADRAEGWIEIESDASNAPLVRIAATGVAAPVSAPAPAQPAAGDGGGSGSDAGEGSGGGALSPGWLVLLLAGVAALGRQRPR